MLFSKLFDMKVFSYFSEFNAQIMILINYNSVYILNVSGRTRVPSVPCPWYAIDMTLFAYHPFANTLKNCVFLHLPTQEPYILLLFNTTQLPDKNNNILRYKMANVWDNVQNLFAALNKLAHLERLFKISLSYFQLFKLHAKY